MDKIKNTHDSGEAEVDKVTGSHKRPKDKNVGDKNADTSAAEKVQTMPSGAVRKEDLDILFDGTELSEEFQEQAFVLFEGAVSAKIESLKEAMEAEFEEKLAESVESYEDKLSDFIDIFVENYMQENELAIENGIKAEIAESLLDGLKNLFVEHNVEIDEDKVEIVEALSERVAELEGALNEALESKVTTQKLIENFEKERILAEMTSDMDEVSKDRIKKLTENISFKDATSFEASVNILKESVSSKKTVVKEDMLNEEVAVTDGLTEKVIDPKMAAILKALRD
jgi:hypothetical protein